MNFDKPDEEKKEKLNNLCIFDYSMTDYDLTEDEIYILQEHLYDTSSEYRCPACNEKSIRYIKISGEKYANLHKQKYGVIRMSRKYHCFNCKKDFNDLKKLALIDGIFLDKNVDLKARSQRYIEEICKELLVSDDVKNYAIEILKDYHDRTDDDIWGRRSVVSASIYISALLCGERRTQMEIEVAANVKSVTISKWYKKINEILQLIV